MGASDRLRVQAARPEQNSAGAGPFDRADNLSRRQRPRSPVQPGSGMRSRSTQEQVPDRRFVSRPSEQRSGDEQLIERKLTVKDVAAGQSVGAFEVERRDHLPGRRPTIRSPERTLRWWLSRCPRAARVRASQVVPLRLVGRVLHVRRDDMSAGRRERRIEQSTGSSARSTARRRILPYLAASNARSMPSMSRASRTRPVSAATVRSASR